MEGSVQQGNEHTPAMLAVLVLYRMHPQDSPAYRCMLARRYRPALFVWDNSPDPETFSPTEGVTFHADRSNPGLAAAYNAALAIAQDRGLPWLMVLDQDTVVTPAFLDEVSTALAHAGSDVVALVPRLRHRGSIVSPVMPRLIGPHKPFEEGRPLQAFNSGAVLRVSALTAVGGFDARFPLEYLDHATFASLQRRGGKVEVLEAVLDHALSTDTGRALSMGERDRQRSILVAEQQFYRLHGSTVEVLLHPVRLLRRAASVLMHKRDWASAGQMLRAAFLPNGKA